MRLAAIIVLGLMGIYFAVDDAPPAAPEGYTWQGLAAVNGAVLKPEGWFFKEEIKGDISAFYVSKEDIEQEGLFETGISIFCLSKIPETSERSPSAYIVAYVELADSELEIFDKSSADEGEFKTVMFSRLDAPPDKISITILTKLIANDKTGKVYLIIFESPTEEWDEARKIGDVMLANLKLDPDT